jgi:hypothetical protein
MGALHHPAGDRVIRVWGVDDGFSNGTAFAPRSLSCLHVTEKVLEEEE